MNVRLVQPPQDADLPEPAAGWRPAANELWVWRLAVPLEPAVRDRWARWLSPAELERLARFRRAEDQERFLAGRGWLRTVLGACVRLPAADVPLGCGPFGKPLLTGRWPGWARLCFSVSHSGDLVAVALTCTGEVGVDVEAAGLPPDWQGVAGRFLAPSERRALARLPATEQPAAFFRCWTRKEACLKATGRGLAADPATTAVTLLPGQAARLLRVDGSPPAGGGWWLGDVDVPPGYAGAVAVWAGAGGPDAPATPSGA